MTPADHPLLLDLGAVAEAGRELVGGKAQSLGVLTAAGFSVPGGFVLTTCALDQFLAAPALTARVAEVTRALANGAGEPDEAMLAAVRADVLAAPLPATLADALHAAYTARFPGAAAVAVRSSGTREDLEGASFAGQYETFLNVRGAAELERAVKQCWASLWQPRVLAYARHRGGGADGLSMSVVVQELVAADVAGVLFTVNPLTGDESEALIEAVPGLGEALVSGKVNVDRYVVDVARGATLRREIGAKETKIVAAVQGTEEVALAGSETEAPTLDEAQLRALTELGAAIQEHYGRPMDIEWVYAGGRLSVVQARPITQLNFAPELGEWTTADFRDGGVSAGVCSPFMYSLYELAMSHSMPDYFKDLRLVPRDHDTAWIRMFFARPYWSMGEVKRALERIPGYREDSFHADLGIGADPEHPGKTTPTTVGGVVRALPTLFALLRSYKERLAINRAYVAGFAERKRPFDLTANELRGLDAATFEERIEQLITSFYLDTESTYFFTIYNTSNSKLDFSSAFAKVNQACGGGLGELDLVSGLTNLSHLRPMKDMHRVLTELRAAGRSVDDIVVRDFAQRWGHHGRKELDIRVPRWADDLGFVRDMLERALAAFDPASDPDAHERAQRARFETARAQVVRGLRWRPFLRRSFAKKLERMRTYAWWREEMRDYSSYLYHLVRAWTLESARRLVAAGVLAEVEDIWALPFQDALAAGRGTLSAAEVRARVRAGQRLLRSFRNFANPNEIRSHGASRTPASVASGNALRGTGCSPGRVTARARVVRTLEEAAAIEAGEVLVTLFTDPGWTPLFARIAAVVTETGGVLSHAAVISREYGIPAVLAVAGATRAIRDGDTVTIDGAAGTVDLVR
jgi:phosphohistidine swiveling domain-containing protein